MNVSLFYMNPIADGAADSNPYYTAFAAKVDNIASLGDAERQDLKDRAPLGSEQQRHSRGYRQLRQTMLGLQAIRLTSSIVSSASFPGAVITTITF